MNRIKESVKTFLDAFAAQMSVVFRDQGILLILCFLTFGYPILYSLIYNPELVRDVETVVIDHDRTALSRFSDASLVADWAAESVAAMIERNIIGGSNGKLNPTGKVTRAEVAKMLYALKYQQ